MTSNTILARNFRIEEKANVIEVKCDIVSDDFPDHLVFGVHPDNRTAIDIVEPNWAALSLIYQAMLMGRNLVIEADISPMLMDNIRGDLAALLHNYEPSLKDIRIEAGTTSTPAYLNANKDIATGFSAGVDSFTTCSLYARPEVPRGVRLTGLAIFDLGALGTTTLDQDRISPARARCKAYADKIGLKTYSVAANMDEMYFPAQSHGIADLPKTVGFRNAAAALVLQKEIGIYRPSPNVGYDRASYGPENCTEQLDAVLQPLLSTEGLQFRPGAAGMSRRAKIRYLADLPDPQRYLDVCVSGNSEERYRGTRINCSKCWKCVTTMLALEAHGKLDNFAVVFDVDYYRANRTKLLQMVSNLAHGPRFARWNDDFRYYKKLGVSIPRPDLGTRVRKIARPVVRPLRAWAAGR